MEEMGVYSIAAELISMIYTPSALNRINEHLAVWPDSNIELVKFWTKPYFISFIPNT